MVNEVLRVFVKDHLNMLDDVFEELKNMEVLVGIPNDEKNQRENENAKKYKITNAQLLYVHTHGVRRKAMREEMRANMKSRKLKYSQAYQLYIQSHGSPLWHVPPRPVIEPAIEKNKEKIAELLGDTAKSALDGKYEQAKIQMEQAGMFAQNAVRDYFTDEANGWPANSPITIARKGSDKPLIDTGEMRRAITYVIRDRRAKKK